MITLSNGHILEFIASSGALGFDGKGYWWEQPLKYLGLFDVSLFTPITKTLTYNPRKGNGTYSCVRFIKDGVVNAMGLPNPGFYKWLKENKNYNGIISIDAECSINNAVEMVNELNKTNIIGIEFNISCPNVEHKYSNILEILKIIKEITNIPLILKISISNYPENINEYEKYIEAITINSVPWNYVYPNIESPLSEYGGGGVSGKDAQKYNWKLIQHLKSSTKISIVGSSVWDYGDIQTLYNMGCDAIGFGSIFLRYPWRPTLYVKRYKGI